MVAVAYATVSRNEGGYPSTASGRAFGSTSGREASIRVLQGYRVVGSQSREIAGKFVCNGGFSTTGMSREIGRAHV